MSLENLMRAVLRTLRLTSRKERIYKTLRLTSRKERIYKTLRIKVGLISTHLGIWHLMKYRKITGRTKVPKSTTEGMTAEATMVLTEVFEEGVVSASSEDVVDRIIIEVDT